MSFHTNMRALRHAIYFSGVVMLLCYGLFYYQYSTFALFKPETSERLIHVISIKQAALMFCLAFLSSLAGFLYAPRLHLPGWGALPWPPRHLGWLVAFTCVGSAGSYFLFDRTLMQLIPSLYPKSVGWALVVQLAGVVSQEAILRLGLLTVLLYFMQRIRPYQYPWPAFVCIAVFSGVGSYLHLAKFNLIEFLSFGLFGMALTFNFVLQWIYCHCYIRYGLWVTLALHTLFSIKFIIYALI